MVRRALWMVVLLCGCEKKHAPAAPPVMADAAPPKLAANQFDATIDGKPVKLRFAKAILGSSGVFANEGLTIRLSDKDDTCATVATSMGVPIELDVPPGPGDAYFVGAATGARAYTLRFRDGLPDVAPWDVQLKLDPVDAKAGAHLTGSLDIDSKSPEVHVHGTLDVEICAAPTPVGLPTTVPDAPLAGTWSYAKDKGTVVAKTALAFAKHRDEDLIESVELFDTPDVTCATARETDPTGFERSTAQLFIDFPTVRTGTPPIGVMLPARFTVPAMSDTEIRDAHAWIRIDTLAKGELRFAMAARRAGGAGLQVDAAGMVVARVCPP